MTAWGSLSLDVRVRSAMPANSRGRGDSELTA
jgi:hypothetical protein